MFERIMTMFTSKTRNSIWRHDSSHMSKISNPWLGIDHVHDSEADLDEMQLLNMVKFLELVVSSEVRR